MIRLNPYINFKDNTREVMAFYQTVFGGKITMNTFQEFNMAQDPADANKIMHSQLDGDNGVVFMAADTPSHTQYQPVSRISMSLSGDDDAVLRGYWDKLSANGTIVVPLEISPWGDAFGMLVDKFGTDWMINIAGRPS